MAEKDQNENDKSTINKAASIDLQRSPKKAKCPFGASCYKSSCQLQHPPQRNVCSRGKKCDVFECVALHPPFRRGPCNKADQCFNAQCYFLHPIAWNPCPQKSACINNDCDKVHPPERSIPKAVQNVKITKQKDGKTLSQHQRDQRRRQAALPILTAKDQFIKRLKEDKFVVIKAETGSGKTTQLPQYAAEAFQTGQIVCTQPRAIAAISIAQRIAQEFDGSKVGHNVGYQIGRGNSEKGERIMLMTDASLVNAAQEDPLLQHISVLIIDEAHERSLNTDIVLGIARMIRSKRPNDFYIVIASATIDPKPFLDFFGSQADIYVPARKFKIDITHDEASDPEDLLSFSSSSLLIDKVIASLTLHKIGNCLVFLPGSLDVDRAVKHFAREAPKNFFALPLYGGLPPEEQMRVMEFNDQGGSHRMVVFCTNVAETSITVPNVRLVIDTGLAKEARYDPTRRITVLEQVFISKSSADQRAGRAGRVADGHCIRLFPPSAITRDRIQPEILRSSLDKVVLALCAMKQDPRTFPLIDSPSTQDINRSIDTLLHLECLDADSLAITELGKLFSEMPFDPRTS
jgi:HrpA-like RNA helicase